MNFRWWIIFKMIFIKPSVCWGAKIVGTRFLIFRFKNRQIPILWVSAPRITFVKLLSKNNRLSIWTALLKGRQFIRITEFAFQSALSIIMWWRLLNKKIGFLGGVQLSALQSIRYLYGSCDQVPLSFKVNKPPAYPRNSGTMNQYNNFQRWEECRFFYTDIFPS